MALGALLEASGAEQKVAWRTLGAILERLRWLPNGLGEIDRRSGGGQEEVEGASLAGPGSWGAPLIKDNR